ncbi:MAG: TRAP transporter large permease, partial [Oscillibacter sp.]|nr:TRAP transporter large permease [Oscillibacter sp.]
LMGAGLIAAALILGRGYDLKVQPKASGKERWDAFKDAFFGLMMPVIILGGIYGGIFTPTEAAAVSVFYGLAVGVFIYREIDFKKLIDIMIDSCSTTATVMFITMGATLFAYVLTRARLDLTIKDFMLTVTNGNWIIFFIIVNIVLLIAGCFLDSTSALYIFTPLFAPVAAAMGISPIHLGVVMIVNLAIGLFTPPVGVNLYVACGIGDIKIEEISKGIIPCLVAELVVLLLCTYVPFVSTMFVS